MTLNSVHLTIKSPPKISRSSSVGPISLAVGTSDDEEYFIKWFTPIEPTASEKIWDYGDYFSERFPFLSETDVYLNYCYTTGFQVGPSFSTTDTTVTGTGNGYTSILIYASSTSTEYFNGFSWQQNLAVLTRASDAAAVGPAESCLVFGGYNGSYHNRTQFFNNVTWVYYPNLPYSARGLGGVGSDFSALAFGGCNASAVFNSSALFDGASWTQVANLNQSRYGHAGFGKAMDALGAGGRNGVATYGTLSSCERFNGSPGILLPLS
ncbi:MAG: hypothetical protein QW835_00140 [Candidatus Hadarchaeum sp.]